MAFLDDLSPLPGPATANMAAKTSNATRAAAFPTDSITSRMAAIRAKKKSDQVMMIYIGGGIAAVVLLLVVVAMSMRADGDATKKKTEKEVVRFGLTDSVRHELFGKFILAVDQYGVTKDCKAEWLRLADAYKLDRRRIGDVLDEGFSRNDWDQPAPAHITNKTRGARMEWHAGRANGGDPILAF